MLRILRVLALLLIVCPAIASAERVEDLPRPQNYVSDFAGVLSTPTKQQLDALCAQLDRQAHAQIAVVTIKSLEGQPIENFATALEEKWKVGPKGSDRGAILILAAQDHKYRIEIGYGLEGILPDGLVGNIGRQMVPYLRQGNYDQAVGGAVGQMAQIIAADAKVTLGSNSLQRPPPQPQPFGLGKLVMLGIVLFVIVVFLSRFGGSGLLGFLIGMFFGGGWGGGGGMRGGGDWNGGGGGFGGFGGGSSGGGGASGSW